MKVSGKEALCEILQAEGVRYVFGNPGSTEIPLLDALVNYPNIKYVLALHEGDAVAMADGYARSSGVPGVVSIHAAPGTSNALANLYNAHIDLVPLVVMAGQQDSRMLVRQPFLSADLVRLTSQFTKWSWQVSRIEELGIAVRRAFKEATSPPTGPVFLALSRNVLDEVADFDPVPPVKYRIPDRIRGDANAILKAAEMLVDAEKPVVFAGEGVGRASAQKELVQLAELIGARVYGEPGAFPTNHRQYLAPIDRQHAGLGGAGDVILAVGLRLFHDFSYSGGSIFPPETRVIHVHDNSWEIAKNHPVDVGIFADVKTGLKELVTEVRELLSASRLEAIENRLAEVKRERENLQASLENEVRAAWDALPIRVPRLIREMQEVLPDDAIIVDQAIRGSGYLKRLYQFTTPGTYYIDGGGTLGWGIGAAVGVQFAQPNRKVVALVGDGGMNFGPKALWSAARHDVPVTVIVMNNVGYAAVKSMLSLYKGEAAKQGDFTRAEIAGVDYVKLAESYGVRGWRVEKPDEIRPALEAALESGKTALIEIVVDPKDAGFGVPRLP
ncbi:MAG: thiamine pyrophosphate-binding protein [Chloroflexi bacterium]|nr:thiamine pyrophosphate-binding protein [Chloroflexota bacterium]MDA8186633.1 thiamine pyrophosphate-binding protein [Dehalococcoidales bacterium]